MLTLKHKNDKIFDIEFIHVRENPDGVYLSRHEANILRNAIIGAIPKDVSPNDVGKLACIRNLKEFANFIYDNVLTVERKNVK